MQYSGIQIFAKSNPKQIDVLHLRDNHLSGTFPKTNWTMNSNYLESEFHHPIYPCARISLRSQRGRGSVVVTSQREELSPTNRRPAPLESRMYRLN
ncbi:hypothetical protein CEXT_191671 [Caerostris extrusa]|uniref:Uncharacterized protein n=1 Tax=Caerostris extrusa TaxID=172846 RepID=A0AAV4R6S6_CAEEX|nr:hypothetical protein CEXT_191671 [Caerostris extrusa]